MTEISISGAPSGKMWETLPWQKIQHHVRRLQMRIAKAQRQGRRGKAKTLQRLLTHSFYAKCLAVKRVVLNKGAHTSGVDHVVWRTSCQKMKAVQGLRRKGYKPLPLKRIEIPKKSGGKRPLSIPCMKDRAMQALWHMALIPIAEDWADPNSYGFRPKRSVHDAIEQCFIVLSRRISAPWIFEGDIKACFDQLSHIWLEKNIPMDKQILRKFLKAGFVEQGQFSPTLQGAPQGGIISPTLMLMALSGLESELKKRWPPPHRVHMVSYADDFIITGHREELLQDEIIPFVRAFLKVRGLRLSEIKSKITPIEEGFDFLGFHIRKYKGRLLIKPAKANIKGFLREIRKVIRSLGHVTEETLVRILNQKIIGFAQFFRHVCSSKAFSSVDKEIYESLLRWMKRRHPTKSKTWRNKRYFRFSGPRNWQFTARCRGKANKRFYLDLAWAKHATFKRHIKIRGAATPFDPDFKSYFEERAKRKSFLPKVWKNLAREK